MARKRQRPRLGGLLPTRIRKCAGDARLCLFAWATVTNKKSPSADNFSALAGAGAISGEPVDGATFTRMIIGPVKGIQRMINRPAKAVLLGIPSPLPVRVNIIGKQRIFGWSERLSWLESQRHQFLRHLSHERKPAGQYARGTEPLADQVVGPLTPEQRGGRYSDEQS